MNLTVIFLALMTFCSTAIGGTVAIRLRKYLPYFFAFAAGSLIAVAFFDIFPEALAIAADIGMPIRSLMIALVASYLFYNFLERFFLIHHYHAGQSDEKGHVMGPIGAGSLVVHSFLDGVAIGVAYQVNPAIGIIVALAVILHDFNDGINTVTVMFRNKHNVKMAALFLFFDAFAPILGVLSTYAILIPESYLAIILAIFTGEFIYLGASSIMRETFQHTWWKMMLPTTAAALLIFMLTSII
ncbi:MAG: ZIP family metal transporter [Candidatus Micrarchaeota archaeon]|nr:ZIP family metal transporter [Candidatus Micrarchaeota archaeon]MDE1849552.1 ZIP family metal transporter [Candidatus Micrarchaeota archaeon]